MKDSEERDDEKDPMMEMHPQNRIVDIWEHNFFEEMDKIMALIPEYNYVAMDTEFPGCPEVPASITDDYGYQLVKINVDQCKLIQLGITLFNKDGKPPPGQCCWQFNFKFDKDHEKSAEASIKVLIEAGIEFDKHQTIGIDPLDFSYYFLSSGLVLNKEVKWICFHGTHDFGYMYRVLVNTPLPDSEDAFSLDLNKYFPALYDTKYMKHEIEELRGGLQKTGELLNLERIGMQHQAGSDSWLTGLVFFELCKTYLNGKDIDKEFNNVIYGLGISENDEGYIELYTNKTEEIERRQREMDEQNDYQQFDHNYYDMGHHQPDNYPMYMQDVYQSNPYSGQPMMHHPSPMSSMGFSPSMGQNMPQGHYAMPQNSSDYQEDDGNMQYTSQYQLGRHPQLSGQPEDYHNYGNGY
eukprot:CAMPEP_0197004632 /NCGR_PEP_ID=MMETSP1380-20130617/24307_1 /TAXON_ID=5936 /ORGANISM="Euplotes crassus, Strain CT5" /LENGTH=408 /DNA_ID=CAMNT_0042423491 /DNA_START=17 /DNA_END=1243 /DNA_ORIENTATION=+